LTNTRPLNFDADRLSLDNGEVLIEWSRLGEGLYGDYDPDDPEDVELLRFDVSVSVRHPKVDEVSEGCSVDGEWVAVPDASYCTQVPVNTPLRLLHKGLELIFNEVYEPLAEGDSIKRRCAALSWMTPDSIKNTSL